MESRSELQSLTAFTIPLVTGTQRRSLTEARGGFRVEGDCFRMATTPPVDGFGQNDPKTNLGTHEIPRQSQLPSNRISAPGFEPDQIWPGSSGSGSRTGTSGFSGGSIGSWTGGGIGSAGARNEYRVGLSILLLPPSQMIAIRERKPAGLYCGAPGGTKLIRGVDSIDVEL